MKKTKKIISVFLAVLMLLSSLCAFAFAAEKEEVIPLIIVPGYSASDLFLNNEDGTQEHIWGVQAEPIVKEVVKNLDKLGISIANLTKGDKEMLIKTVGDAIRNLYGKLSCNDDGSSTYDIVAGPTDPAKTTTKYLVDTDGEDSPYLHLKEINLYFASLIGGENVYNCHIDFRQNAVKCAQDLDKYVSAVKKYTGSDKVRLYGLSHGGMTVGVYLSLLANHPELVSNNLDSIDSAVMFHPALAGAYFLTDFMNESLHIDIGAITEYAQVGAFTETELELITQLVKLDLIDDLANSLVDEIFDDIAGNWGSVWDFVPTDHYEQYKAQRLDATKNAKLIAASDMMHYQIMPNYADAFAKAKAAGVKVSIFSGYGRQIITGAQIDSDAILSCASTSGAKCAPIGSRFADGYKQSGNVCTDPTHNHVSPSMEIDASYSYLPENTWFVRGQLHGQVWWDDFTKVLCGKLLFEDDIKDVYSDPNYPQFVYSQNPKDEIKIAFDNAETDGRLSVNSTGVYITNLSKKYSVKILSAYTQASDLKISAAKAKTIAPGETAFFKFLDAVPDYNMVRDSFIVNYVQVGTASAAGVKNFPVTIVGGKDVVYDESNPYSDVNMVDPFDNVIKDSELDSLFSWLNIKKYFSSLYNTIMKYFGAIVDFVKGLISLGD